jgi:integrase
MKRHLSELTIQRVRPPKEGTLEIFDLGYPGLALRVGHGGAKTFEHFHRAGGKLRRETIGRWPSVSLAKARDQWRQTREAIAKGEVVVHSRGGPLFEVVVEEWLRRDQADSKPSSLYQLGRIVETNLLPAWRGKSVAEIRKSDIVRLLDGIVDRGAPASAKKIDAYLRRFFRWSRGRDIIAANPMDGMEALAKGKSRDRVLTDAELVKVWHAASEGPHAAAIRLLVLTGARREEISQLKWSEILGDKIVLAGPRTKNGDPHTIHLSAPAQDVLRSVERIAGSEYVFTLNGTKPIGSWGRAKAALDKACGVTDWHIHDIRRTVSTGANELGVEPHIVEAILGHAVGGVAGIYNKAKHEGAKRAALDVWGAHVVNNIVRR